MKHILLIGAGFSRNWGGWLASEMTGELCSRVADDPNLLMLLRGNDNFEVVLGNLRRAAESGGAEASAIFTLNQDLLLETNYYNHKQPAGDPQWAGYCFPGVPPPQDWSELNAKARVKQRSSATHFRSPVSTDSSASRLPDTR